MDKDLLTIGEAADFLGVVPQTLRRWDAEGRLPAVRAASEGHRYYRRADLEAFLSSQKDIFRRARHWAFNEAARTPADANFCPDAIVFQTRLKHLEATLGRMDDVKDIYQLLTASAGEIGNNSFDHNLGNWPDIRGIFFGYDAQKRKIAIADRGQGLLTTLRRVRPDLGSDLQALKVAFTEIVSGRAPEARGNGLKFVRKAVEGSGASLVFQSGNARLELLGPDYELKFMETPSAFRGCIAFISF